MAKPSHVSRYYADDKDVFDLLSQSTITPAKLRGFLRSRGIVLSPKLTKEQICRYFQTSQLSWTQLEGLLELIERPDREDKFATCRIESKEVTVTEAAKAANKVKELRAGPRNEVYQIKNAGKDVVEVTVKYSEPNLNKTRCLQNDDKSLVVRLERDGDHFKVRYHENNRALEIVDLLEQQLVPAAQEKSVRQEITVSGLNSTQRSKFFVEMARGIVGYELKDEKGLQVDRPLDSEVDEDEDENEKPAPKKRRLRKQEADEQFQGLVKRALLHGTSLLMSSEYQNYSKNGYSLSKLIWTVEPTNGDGAIIEFGAEFRDGERGTGFRYGVLGKFDKYENGTFAKTRRSVKGPERDGLLDLLESSAYGALEKAKEPLNPSDTEPG